MAVPQIIYTNQVIVPGTIPTSQAIKSMGFLNRNTR